MFLFHDLRNELQLSLPPIPLTDSPSPMLSLQRLGKILLQHCYFQKLFPLGRNLPHEQHQHSPPPLLQGLAYYEACRYNLLTNRQVRHLKRSEERRVGKEWSYRWWKED